MSLQKTIKCVIRLGEEGFYVAECLEIPVVTQGETLDETAMNLKEAVELFLDGEDASEYGLVSNPGLIVTFELEPGYAQA
ncbi:MAG TPA: type II toxin-antitoxin system HicB family antitoxin [Ignavibacteria bacterium]|nr:type II toxin-antitoxin system HicB family antitoxin [Ignavibacteria bacterium]